MLRLDTVNRKIVAALSTAGGTDIHFTSSFSDKIPPTTYEGKTRVAKSNGVTSVDVVDPPGATAIRDIDSIIARNAGAAVRTVTISYSDSGTLYDLASVNLAAGSTLSYTHGRGWQVMDSSGQILQSIAPAMATATGSSDPGGRLTLTTGVPLTTSTVTSATLYYTPFNHNEISLWTGTVWTRITFTEIALPLGALTYTSGPPPVPHPYDIYGYLSGGALAIEKLAWATPSARAVEISLQDGRYCKVGDKSRLYLGTIASVSTTTTEDGPLRRMVWNAYNQVPRHMIVVDTTDQWTYVTPAWRKANGSYANRLQFVVGNPSTLLCDTKAFAYNSGASGYGGVGIGVDTETTSNAQITNMYIQSLIGSAGNCVWRGVLPPGVHYFQWMEYGSTDGTGGSVWYGDIGPSFATVIQTGMYALGTF